MTDDAQKYRQTWMWWAEEGGKQLRIDALEHGGVRVTIVVDDVEVESLTLADYRADQIRLWLRMFAGVDPKDANR